jgi:hypothetical protein
MKTIKVTLIEDAFLNDDGNYIANAVLSENTIDNTDDEESGYPINYAIVKWTVFDDFDGDDGSNACDWSNPEGVIFNGNWIADKTDGVNQFKGCIFEYINTDGSAL